MKWILEWLFDLAEFELDPNPVSFVDLVSNQTMELKPDSGSKMASPMGIATQFIQAFFFTFSLAMTFY